MLGLASMIWAAYMYVASAMDMRNNVPPPVVIEVGKEYKYDPVYSAIYIPADWNDSCNNQRQIVLEMAEHFNNFRNGQKKAKQETLIGIKDRWVCLCDTKLDGNSCD